MASFTIYSLNDLSGLNWPQVVSLMTSNDLKRPRILVMHCSAYFFDKKYSFGTVCAMLLKLQTMGSRQRLVLNLNAKEFLVRKGGFRAVHVLLTSK